MKISIAALLATATTASAFVPLNTKSAPAVASRMSEEESPEAPAVMEAVAEEPAVVAAPQPRMSQSLPWMECPPALDGTMAGDVGFDPLGFAKSSEDLMNYREAEVSLKFSTGRQILALTRLTPYLFVSLTGKARSLGNVGRCRMASF